MRDTNQTSSSKRWCNLLNVVFVLLTLCVWLNSPTHAQAPSRQVIRGTIASITDDVLTVNSDEGSSVQVRLSPDAQIRKLPVGSTDFTNASSASVSDLNKGDRVLIPAAIVDSGPLNAKILYVMKANDIGKKLTEEQADWQRRGISGLVHSVNIANNAVTITMAGTREITIHLKANSQVMRYAADSIKFADAKSSELAIIRVGDQLAARGDMSPDGRSMSAAVVISGSFRNIAGTVAKIDSVRNSLTVIDLSNKTLITITITNNSDMHTLPASVAANFAARLKSKVRGAGSAASGSASDAGRSDSTDLTQIIGSTPHIGLVQLKVGDAVLIAATASSNPSSATAITVLGGVEPILTASPSDVPMTLTPWNISRGN